MPDLYGAEGFTPAEKHCQLSYDHYYNMKIFLWVTGSLMVSGICLMGQIIYISLALEQMRIVIDLGYHSWLCCCGVKRLDKYRSEGFCKRLSYS